MQQYPPLRVPARTLRLNHKNLTKIVEVRKKPET